MRKTDELLRKYWEGKTTLDEEKWLKEHSGWSDGNKHELEYFNYLQSQTEDKIRDGDFEKDILNAINSSHKRSRSISLNYWRVAAAVILLITASIVLNEMVFEKQNNNVSGNNVVIVDTYDDPEKALEETKKALMFLSGKLNEGGAYTMEIKKFNESQEMLKKK